ncbi:ROK family protein [Virgisporangium ochraceum]|uniref:Polyphosphate glucokinase n=1 Tax=Virgisporangium ochraceum TaxID=65505 RepID=A0A8J3ZN36_9ACTN|nr:ROK family protein [Virgisporangium ochraceum]GIJ65992.1 polyphosphate glucokinase [Virgisporangium ochraceum]
MTSVGIDVGGSGVKGAVVDVSAGDLVGERFRLETPRPADVTNLVETVAAVAAEVGPADHWGITFPGVILDGHVRTAANLDPSWVDVPGEAMFAEAVGGPVTLLNDADAAGLAEVRFGAGRGQRGVTLMLTFGTGIGSALFVEGNLVPNTEFGHLELDGFDAETRASDRAREVEELDWPEWAERVQRYLSHVEGLVWPDLIIIGGGVSKKTDKWLSHVDIRTPIVPATLQNHAGIIGAAVAAAART